MMDVRDENNYVFNIRLAKRIGLYQMLDPETIKYHGKNVYHIVAASIALYLFVFSIILNVSGVYYWTNNMPISVDYFWKAETSMFVIYKIWILIHHSKDLWNCLSVTWYGYTTFNIRNKRVLDRWRERTVWFTNVLTLIYWSSVVIYTISTLVFREDIISMKNYDGSIGNYRQNVMNLYLIVSDETYNRYYYTFYLVESVFLIFLVILFPIFDILLITLCFAICGQMQMIFSAFKSVGYESICDPVGLSIDEKKKTSDEHDLIYDELKTNIFDHQAVMKKYEDFLALFGKAMLLQIFFSSFSLIVVWSIFIMSFDNNDRFEASDIVLKKMMCSLPALMFQIFMVCYLFDKLHKQKDSVIFALYSSNWTKMDMKCKKLILLTMRMNNANYKKLKFTRTKVVNLEMFFKTMGDCYTILSVLVNY
ncbi:odorant receptor 94b-like, partial [Aphis gossypii]|uniref:odorant receptor 94b-like n=1 Tax=Aphis gossypii TaxID=80765 RepID=UPI0021596FFB